MGVLARGALPGIETMRGQSTSSQSKVIASNPNTAEKRETGS
ncbi:MAG TPA: hypothetical protein PLI05_04140 [Methanotrichaceae archaeon]|nr:hypothetical protein [Methanotrichaceae archaeon]HQF16243.1 hypothetical protein [Methanotrichaceae archaeon]HQI90015.1 hypothetical protein [Methanotrichaceae archaeon]HQJ27961.1 hypothetical protein [Methanotrichaceae archaeon]